MEDEEWRTPVCKVERERAAYEKYEISNHYRLRNKYTKKIIAPFNKRVRLKDKDVIINRKLRSLVKDAFPEMEIELQSDYTYVYDKNGKIMYEKLFGGNLIKLFPGIGATELRNARRINTVLNGYILSDHELDIDVVKKTFERHENQRLYIERLKKMQEEMGVKPEEDDEDA